MTEGALVLVGEDELLVGQVLCDLLASAGYAVLGPAAKGAEVLELARGRKPDLLVLDIGLRGAMSGIEAAKVLQKEMDVPVLFLSGYATEDIARRIAEVRGASVLTKPILAEKLFAEVRKILGNR